MSTLSKIFIWLFVIVVGLELGAGLYETIVVLPLWMNSPPDSVLEYYRYNAANPQFALNAGPRFWIVQTPLTGLISLLTIVTGFKTEQMHRKWRMIGAGLTLLVVICTFSWFVPNLISLLYEGVTKMQPTEITSTTDLWVTLNWVRVAAYFAGWLAGLRALTIPSN